MQSHLAALLALCVVPALAGRHSVRNAPDVAAQVAMESAQNIQIHDGFASQEKQDIEVEQQIKSARKGVSALAKSKWVVALDKDLKTKMLVQLHANTSIPVKDPCANIPCAASLTCPGGFLAETVPGHCCPYCVNPNVEVKPEVTGATGEAGGKASTFCDDVWCFPTMCLKTEVAPTTTNGQCCPKCP